MNVGGNLTGDFVPAAGGTSNDSDDVANWLWRQGGSINGTSEATAWWINFGTYTNFPNGSTPVLTGFTGIERLAAAMSPSMWAETLGPTATSNTAALTAAVASTGRVLSDGTELETGGGNLTVNVGGKLNSFVQSTVVGVNGDQGGTFTDLRGDIAINAGAVGTIVPTQTFSGTGKHATRRSTFLVADHL